jgi:hypothetical protein
VPPPEAIAGVVGEYGISPAELRAELEQFRDYWAGVAGARGVKLDWPATLRNRLRDQAKAGKIGGHFETKKPAAELTPAQPWLIGDGK